MRDKKEVNGKKNKSAGYNCGNVYRLLGHRERVHSVSAMYSCSFYRVPCCGHGSGSKLTHKLKPYCTSTSSGAQLNFHRDKF